MLYRLALSAVVAPVRDRATPGAPTQGVSERRRRDERQNASRKVFVLFQSPELSETARPASPVSTARATRTFDVFVGSESFLLAKMRNGGVGTISATANVNPAAIHKLYTESVRSRTGGNSAVRADLDEQQARLNVVRDLFGRKYPMIAALKQAIAIYTNDPAWAKVRPPLVELTAEQARSLFSELKAISFTMPGLSKSKKSEVSDRRSAEKIWKCRRHACHHSWSEGRLFSAAKKTSTAANGNAAD